VSRSADIVVVGGGIAGASVAYHLARRRAGRIVLLEREILCGTGATRASAGGTRKLFSAEVNVRMSVESQALYARFEEELGTPIEPRHTTAAVAHSRSPCSCELCPGSGSDVLDSQSGDRVWRAMQTAITCVQDCSY
jgi:glycine/D-amino acid oxidase-like deaminating enzyme